MFDVFDEKLWQEAYDKAVEEVKGLPVTILTGRRGFSGSKPTVYMDVPVKGNKLLIDKLKAMGWRTLRGMHVQGRRIRELEKTY